MAVEARDHVPELAAVLSIASLALIFGAVLGAIPEDAIPRSGDAVAAIPHVNATISAVAIAAIGVGWRSIREGRIDRHRTAMIAAAALFALFFLLYLYRITLVGPTEFPGPETLYRIVYLPVLAIHVTLAVVCVPLLYYVLLVGLTHPIYEIPRTRHPRVGRIAASLWLVSFSLGIVVYLLLYHLF